MTVSTPAFALSVVICLIIYIKWRRERTQREKDMDFLTWNSFFALIPMFFLSIILMVVFQLIINLYNWMFN